MKNLNQEIRGIIDSKIKYFRNCAKDKCDGGYWALNETITTQILNLIKERCEQLAKERDYWKLCDIIDELFGTDGKTSMFRNELLELRAKENIPEV